MKPTGECPSIVWFRRDLRLADNPALTAAAKLGPVLPVYVWDPPAAWPPGGASRWWLHHSLKSLRASLEKAGSRLIVRQGGALETLSGMARTSGATRVFWNRRYEPESIETDRQIKEALRSEGLEVISFPGSLLCEPWDLKNRAGNPFQVFTPFWKALGQLDVSAPTASPNLLPPAQWPESLPVGSLGLEPGVDWARGIGETWQPGEEAARQRLRNFQPRTARYLSDRDFPERDATTALSPYLAFGEITPRQIWHALNATEGEPLRRQLAWREFAHHLLFHFPRTTDHPLRDDFARFPWKMDSRLFRAWTKGRTGYPIVDAGMRQLWRTGYMHNRVRMIAASFLVKDLLIPWQAGATWFWDTLADADLANNTLGWQWVAGCGADAAPYFRIFNPVLQGEKFDSEGSYVRRWIPELAALPNEWIHRPWEAPPLVLIAAGMELDRDYPRPIIDHAEARKRALEALKTIRGED